MHLNKQGTGAAFFLRVSPSILWLALNFLLSAAGEPSLYNLLVFRMSKEEGLLVLEIGLFQGTKMCQNDMEEGKIWMRPFQL